MYLILSLMDTVHVCTAGSCVYTDIVVEVGVVRTFFAPALTLYRYHGGFSFPVFYMIHVR